MTLTEPSSVTDQDRDAQGIVIVICSYPRSGTHFLLDTLRRNFEALHWTLPVWSSSENLYYNLDRHVDGGPEWSRRSLSRPCTLVKTHGLFFEPALERALDEIVRGRTMVILTPYRRLERSLQSFHRYVCPSLPFDTVLDAPDPYFGRSETVGESLERFYSQACERSVLIDVEAMKSAPETWVGWLSDRLRLKRRLVSPLLPPRRSSHGLVGETLSRLKGRPSSEVVVPDAAAGPVVYTHEARQRLAGRLAALQERLDQACLKTGPHSTLEMLK